MKTFKTIFLTALLFIAPVVQRMHAQQPAPGYSLFATAGTNATLTASVVGTQGTTTAYYTLITNFAGGSVASNIVTVTNTPNTLNSTNYIAFSWYTVPGVVTYDLLKLTSAALPSGSNSVVLRAALSATTTSTTDQGGSLSSYTIASGPSNGVATVILNSRDHTSPAVEWDSPTGSTYSEALNGKILWSANANRTFTDATATGVTITANKIAGGLYFHAPTGAVNDQVDTAANLVAALPACYVNNTSVSGLNVGASFRFALFNNSAGANTITVTTNTGVTLTGTMTVAQNAVRTFIGVVTNCATPAVTIYSLGTGTY